MHRSRTSLADEVPGQQADGAASVFAMQLVTDSCNNRR